MSSESVKWLREKHFVQAGETVEQVVLDTATDIDGLENAVKNSLGRRLGRHIIDTCDCVGRVLTPRGTEYIASAYVLNERDMVDLYHKIRDEVIDEMQGAS